MKCSENSVIRHSLSSNILCNPHFFQVPLSAGLERFRRRGIIWRPLRNESSAGLEGCWIIKVSLYGIKIMLSDRESWPV